MKLHPVIQFVTFLTIGLLTVFFLHTYLLQSKNLPAYANLIVKSYIVNGILATCIYIPLYLFREKLKNHIGFLFMGGSFLKFIFFFVLFYPIYSADDHMDKTEFAAFFVPYAFALAVETVFMAKMLRKMD